MAYMTFSEWEKTMFSSPDYPNDNASRLAIQTIKTCVQKNIYDEVADYKNKISESGLALFDYTMFCYFVYRHALCLEFPRSFVEEYDRRMHYYMASCFFLVYNVDRRLTVQMIALRAEAYERIFSAKSDDLGYEALSEFTQNILKDFKGVPQDDCVVITPLMDQAQLFSAAAESTKKTLSELNSLQMLLVYKDRQTFRSYAAPKIAKKKRDAENQHVEKTTVQKIELKEKLIVTAVVLFIAVIFIYVIMLYFA